MTLEQVGWVVESACSLEGVVLALITLEPKNFAGQDALLGSVLLRVVELTTLLVEKHSQVTVVLTGTLEWLVLSEIRHQQVTPWGSVDAWRVLVQEQLLLQQVGVVGDALVKFFFLFIVRGVAIDLEVVIISGLLWPWELHVSLESERALEVLVYLADDGVISICAPKDV